MILTYKIKHKKNLSDELIKAKKVALFALRTKSRTSKDVKHIGLKSAISNQILKKYSSDKRIKKVSNVMLTVPGQEIKFENKIIRISCLKLEMFFDKVVEKINHIELNDSYAYISCTIKEESEYIANEWIGVDLNTTGHCVVTANPKTGKVSKLGKQAKHVHAKYKNERSNLQKKGKYKAVKRIKNKESRVIKDINHKISRKIVNDAKDRKAGIVLEDLKGIRKTSKQNRNFRYYLHSWSFYQLLQFIIYKAKLLGVPVVLIDPRYTSQQCSKCGHLGERKGKKFKCDCGHVENADVNASFVISLRHQGIFRSPVDRDVGEGLLASPKGIEA